MVQRSISPTRVADAGLGIAIEVDTRPLNRRLTAAVKKQMPFAIARGLTELAIIAEGEAREQLGGSLKIRNKKLLRGGRSSPLRVTPAKKRDHPRSQSEVSLRPWAEFLGIHVEGGVRKAERGRRAIPTRFGASKRTPTGKMPSRWRPRPILDRGGSVDDEGVLRAPVARGPLKGRPSMFLLRDQVRIPSRWPFFEIVGGSVRRNQARVMWSSFDRALRD